MAKKTKEIWKIYKNVFDEFTVRTVLRFMSQRVIDGLESPIKIGKEANIFTAITPEKRRVIVKIYRLESCNFNKMYDYIKQDVRFLHLKKKRREIIFSWVQREYRNLLKAREAGVRVPTPLAYINNVLVLEYIGDSEPALQLKDDIPEDKAGFIEEVIRNYRLLYRSAGLVHGDLSEFNILNYRDAPVLIDFSQSTPVSSPNAEELLKRDMMNLARFSRKAGMRIEEDELLEKVRKS